MYLDKITLHNVRGFEHLEFSLKRNDGSYAGWTVFTGGNGSGKSTLIKAIALGLTGKDTALALQQNFQSWVREGSSDAEIALKLIPQETIDEFEGRGRTTYGTFSAGLRINKSGKVENTPKKGSAERGLWIPQSKGWFSCGYGPFRRVFGASPEATRLMVGQTTERFVTMFQEAASLYEVDQWMRQLNHKKLEGKAEEGATLEMLLEILRDDLLPNQITVDRVDSDGLWLKDRNGVHLAWDEMSDGYRSALALLADILRHLVQAYGMKDLTTRDDAGKLTITKSGVVLIDEIDAHLHPEWQRQIGFWFKRHFPNIQFLVTTHSPLICQAADPNGLFVLPEPGCGEPARALSKEEYESVVVARPDTILLSAAFGLQNTRSPLAVENRARFSRLQAKKRAGVALTQAECDETERLTPYADTGEEA